MYSIKSCYMNFMKPIFQKRGFIYSRIAMNWRAIIGDEFYTFCRPLKFYSGYKHQSGLLTVQVNHSHSLLVLHAKDIMIEKINRYLGKDRVKQIRVLQVPFKNEESFLNTKFQVKQNTVQKKKFVNSQERLEYALSELNKLIIKDKNIK